MTRTKDLDAEYGAVAEPLAGARDAVVGLPTLRGRRSDIAPQTSAGPHARVRARAACERLAGNVRELQQVVSASAGRTEVIDVRHLPPKVPTGTGR